MSDKEDSTDVETLLKLMQVVNNNSNNTQEPAQTAKWILPIAIAVLPILVTMFGVFYNTGVKTQELEDGTKNGKLELQVEFTEKLSSHKDTINRAIIELQRSDTVVMQEYSNQKMLTERQAQRIDELEDTVKSQQRDLDNYYRTQQYLKSQHSLNIPPVSQ